mmetsp:Transcript_2862/g.3343  ORF Transcript_2862/g.3343 Transcript_2862/m.3343 type:complete len:339 (+) Transcript_2862:22-1038(+)|eukprot:CAMPEP_0205818536 /NCGR_PEP_ID=MMETSP0206-20130828/458_1 /ASSEMBLY_ACC=CAM_ASM_000279 /TAXON_ID=36767 /ORGANISM="Euplotes focardii, Strain TN1" /LENGTH=338 /DNA_ID=CAMNT_0053110963 /DNA_START=19 /DNA_END=1035 /DNA_ORIENTATION=+
MKTIAILAIVAVASTLLLATYSNVSSTNDLAFQSFIGEQGRNYANEAEFNMRREIFMTTLEKVNEHNAKGLSWTFGINKFSDWTDEEYQKLLGLRNSGRTSSHNKLPLAKIPQVEFEKDLDWRNHPGFVGPVLNQGSCGSCWAFSAAQALAGAYFKAYGEVVDVSRSQPLDCDVFSHGCNGGLQENAFVHWMKTPFALESEYPYVAEDKTCYEKDVVKSTTPLLQTAFRVDVGADLLYDALAHQPVSISIRAENDDFRHYQGGVITGDGCGWEIDHAVLLVGYGTSDAAWTVKNSWGPDWGEDGYVRIGRTQAGKGICGINQQNSIPLFEDDFEPMNV